MLQEVCFKIATQLFLPDLARQMREEGTFHLETQDAVAELQESNYLHIEDNGADVTIFTFTGPDVLYMGHSRHHLMGVIKRASRRFGGANLVFLRDPRRLGFMLTPEGEEGGLAYYTNLLKGIIEKLGSSHNVAIGASWGGSLAHYMAYTCGMQQVITFSPLFNTKSYLGVSNLARAMCNMRLLATEPRAYSEVVVVLCSAWWCMDNVKRNVRTEMPELIDIYAALEERPPTALYYGEKSPPDSWQAHLLKDSPEVKLVPLPTGRHNVPSYLHQLRKLDKVIALEIQEALSKKAAETPTGAES